MFLKNFFEKMSKIVVPPWKFLFFCIMRYLGGKIAESIAWSVHSDSRRRSAGARIVSCYVGEDVLLARYWLE